VLSELRVRDLATIADVTLQLGPGLNVLTGETGAGKSMLVDALALLLGERALDAEDARVVVRREVSSEGRSRAWVNGSPTTAAVLSELGALLVDLHGQHETQSLLHLEA